VYCGFSSAHAQDRLKKQDSLKKLLAVQQDDTNKVKLLNSLANTYYQTNKDSINYYSSWLFNWQKNARIAGAKQ